MHTYVQENVMMQYIITANLHCAINIE